MAQRVVTAIKLKDVMGEPTVAINAAVQAGTIQKMPNGLPAPEQYVPLGYFVGRVSDQVMHTVKRQNNPDPTAEGQSWPKLVGSFKAWSVDPARDEFVSNAAFLMDHITLNIGDNIREVHKDDPSATLEVLFEVGVSTSDTSSTGFKWVMRNMADMRVQPDPLAALVAQIKGETPALPAPEGTQGAAEGGEPGDEATATGDGGDKVDGGHKPGGRGKRH